jgi:ribosomal protein S18 acetylase RimI-like enzyme
MDDKNNYIKYKKKYINLKNYMIVNEKRNKIEQSDVKFKIFYGEHVSDEDKKIFESIKTNNNIDAIESICAKKTYEFALKKNNDTLFCLNKLNVIVGYFNIYKLSYLIEDATRINNFFGGKGLYIENVCGNQKYTGVAKLLLNHFIDNIETYYKGVSYLTLDVGVDNCAAIISYTSVGFICTGKTYYIQGENMNGMIKFLYLYEKEKYNCDKK